jgi:hypothetical protein
MYVVIKRQETKGSYRQNTPSVIHQSTTDAYDEAKRLASFNVGMFFDVFELIKVGEAVGQINVTWNDVTHTRRAKRK